MANALYDKARERFLGTGGNQINWITDTIKAMLVKTSSGYDASLTTDEFVSHIGSSNIISRSAELTGKSATGGVANADPTTFSDVTGGVCGAIVVYKDTGDDATSPLIAYIDVATGLSLTPNGSDIIINWDTGANKIFKL